MCHLPLVAIRPSAAHLLIFTIIVDFVDLLFLSHSTNSAYVRHCYPVDDYTLCLSTNDTVTAQWSDAANFCTRNGSALVDVYNSRIQSAVQQFRNTEADLSNSGSWIRVSSRGVDAWHWIDGTSTPGKVFDTPLHMDSAG